MIVCPRAFHSDPGMRSWKQRDQLLGHWKDPGVPGVAGLCQGSSSARAWREQRTEDEVTGVGCQRRTAGEKDSSQVAVRLEAQVMSPVAVRKVEGRTEV